MTTQFLETFGSGALIFTDNGVSCQGQISCPAPKAMLEHTDICTDGDVVETRAAGCQTRVQRERTMESFGLEGYPSWSRFGSACARSGGKQQSEELLGTQSSEMGQLRGKNGASSSLKHISRYHLSV